MGTLASNLNTIHASDEAGAVVACPATSQAEPDAMKRILLVDDQAHVLRVMKLTLDRNGYEVDTALSGEVALSMLNEHAYDVMITAVEMPGMNGQVLCQSVQRQFGNDAPLTFVVSDASGDTSDWVAQLPNTECLEKPVSLRWLVARLNEYFGHYDRKHAS